VKLYFELDVFAITITVLCLRLEEPLFSN